MDFAIRVGRAECHLIADDPRRVPVEQRSRKFNVAVADNKINRNAEDIGNAVDTARRAQFLANVRTLQIRPVMSAFEPKRTS